MIRPVDTSLLEAAKAAASPAGNGAAPASGATTSFTTHLKREAEKTSEAKTADPRTRVAERATPPEGEKWRPVKGRDDYAEIIAGDRKGQFVNLNRGARRGEAFTIEERDGKTFHVYKRDDGELVVPIEVDNKEARAAGARASDREPPKNETWGPIDGKQSYADILTGSRNGYYINLQQGSVREGEVFHIVKRGGKEYHVYGEGDDKLWVEVGAKRKSAAAATTAPATGTDASGGATASAGSGSAAKS